MTSIKMLSLSTLFLLISVVSCHSWIEQLTVIAPNGTFVGTPGYARGNCMRGSPSCPDPDSGMVWLLPPNGRSTGNQLLSTDTICKPSQQTQIQTDGSPVLQAAPGDAIALRYQENGHVTLPQNSPGKAENRGTMYVYGTTDPKPDDTLLAIHKVWNAAGTGGDKRGKLLSTSSFDDSRCYQVNNGEISTQRQKEFPHTADQLMGVNMWCQQDLALPTDAPSGKLYTLYWVWDWPTLPGTPGLPNGLNQLYTTCSDVMVQAQSKQKTTAGSYIQNQDLNYAAIPDQMANLGKAPVVSGSSSAPTGAAANPNASSGLPTSVASSALETTTSNLATSASVPVPIQTSEQASSSAVPSIMLTFSRAAPSSSSPAAPAISAMTASGDLSSAASTSTSTVYESVVVVTVTDFVAAPTANSSLPTTTSEASSNAGVFSATTFPVAKASVSSSPYNRVRAREASFETVVVPNAAPSVEKRLYILPSKDRPHPVPIQARPDNFGVQPTAGKQTADSVAIEYVEDLEEAEVIDALPGLAGKSAKFARLRRI